MAIQQLTQPIVNPISAFDATKSQTISFVVIGGAQVIGNRLVISNNETGVQVYNQTQSTMKLEHTIPAGTLTNGGYYNAVIYTIDNSGSESDASIPIPFYCYSTPVLTIDNIPASETIENGTYTFTGSYSQLENEVLNSYQYTLYDSNREILSQTPLIYYQTDSSLSYTFVGMSNDTSYYISLTGETVNGTSITTGYLYFTVRYLQPTSFAICDLVNDCDNGYIQISSNIVAIDGISNPDPPTYIDDKEVDLREDGTYVQWNEGFDIKDDFTMRVWGRDFNPYENIITMTNELDTESSPNKIEMKWMIGEVIKQLPNYEYVPKKEEVGYNLLNYTGISTSKNGLTSVINADGTITISGLPTSSYTSMLSLNMTNLLEDGKTYTMKQTGGANRYMFLQLSLRKSDGTYTYPNLQYVGSRTFTVDKTTYTNYTIVIQCSFLSIWGDVERTITQGYMLYEGTDDKEWQPYNYYPLNMNLTNSQEDEILKLNVEGRSIQRTQSSNTIAEGESFITFDSYNGILNNISFQGAYYQETREGYNLAPINTAGWSLDNNRITNTARNEGVYLLESDINLEANTTYYINLVMLENPTSDVTFAGYIDSTEVAELAFLHIDQYTEGQLYTNTYTPTADCTFTMRMWGNSDSSTFEFQFWVTTDSTKTTYEQYGVMPSPEYPSEIETVSDSVETIISNKNLLNLGSGTFSGSYSNGITTTYDGNYIKSSGTLTNTYSNLTPTIEINLPAGIYTISKGNPNNPNRMGIQLFFEDGTNQRIAYSTGSSSLSTTITTTKKVTSFYIYTSLHSVGDVLDFEDYVQIEQGSTATDYTEHEGQSTIVPIQQEMLPGDYFTIASGEWQEIHYWRDRDIGSLASTGIALGSASTDDYYVFQTSIGATGLLATDLLCEKFKFLGTEVDTISRSEEGIAINASNSLYIRIWIKATRLTEKSVSAFLTWVQEEGLIIKVKLTTVSTALNCTEAQIEALDEVTTRYGYNGTNIVYTTDTLAIPYTVNTSKIPQPKIPSEIYSVGDHKNLIDIADFNITYSQQYYSSTNTNFILKPNYLYTLSFSYTINTAQTDLYYSIGYGTTEYETDIQSTIQYTNITTGRNYMSFIVPSDIPDNSYLWVKFGQTSILSDIDVDISNIQLEEGNSVTDYQSPDLYNIYLTSAGKNLYNYNKAFYLEANSVAYTTIQNGYNIIPTSIFTPSYLAIGFKNILNAGDTYTLSFNQLGNFSKIKLYTTIKRSNRILSEVTLTDNTFTVPSGTYDFRLEFYVDSSDLTNSLEVWNIQIEVGDTATDYETYNSNEGILVLDEPLRETGNERDLVCLETVNILNPSTQSGEVESSTTYYLGQSGTTTYYIWYYNSIGNLITFINEEGEEAHGVSLSSGSFTTHEECVKITITASDSATAGDVTSDDLTSNEVIIAKGSVETPYYPYVSEPSIIRKISSLVFDGTSTAFTSGSATSTGHFFRYNGTYWDASSSIEDTNIYNSHYTVNNGWGLNTSYGKNTQNGFALQVIAYSSFSTLSSYNTWVAEQYNAGTPLTVIYQLQIPTVTTLSTDNITALQSLNTYNPITNVYTNNEALGYLSFQYVTDYTEQQTQNAYVQLKCYNSNNMPYYVHSNYIDIPEDTSKVFIWVRRENNLFDLIIEDLGDYSEDDTSDDTAVPVVTLTIETSDITSTTITVTATSLDETGLKTVRFSKNNGSSWDEIISVDGLSSINTYTFTDLTPSTTYTIKVEALDLTGNIGSIAQQVTTTS